MPASTPKNPIITIGRAFWISRRAIPIKGFAVPILYPFRNVTVNIVQSPSVREFFTHGMCFKVRVVLKPGIGYGLPGIIL